MHTRRLLTPTREVSVGMNAAMVKRENKRPSIRKIHINLPEEVHQRLRVKCALEDVTMQEFVEKLIARNVTDVHLSSVSIGKSSRKGE